MEFFRQDKAHKTLLLACPQLGSPELLYFGELLPDAIDIKNIYLLRSPAVPQGTLDKPPVLSLIPEAGRGWVYSPAVEAHAVDRAVWTLSWLILKVASTASGFKIYLQDQTAQLSLILTIGINSSGVMVQQLKLTNEGKAAIYLTRLLTTMPCADEHVEKITFYGHWCKEFQQQRSEWQSIWLQENRCGRNGHNNFPGLIVGSSGFGEQQGEVLGVNLAWSGNHTLFADVTPVGDRYIQAGAFYLPGEVKLSTGESITSPELLVSHSANGLNAMSQQFHREARLRLQLTKPRPVHINTWEAFYFDHDLHKLRQLANIAAQVGIERYILDDGWFAGRNDDKTGLGDWFVDRQKYPNGLSPLIEHVKSLGMEFGLWLEPEMLNLNSALYRSHPDWVLELPAQKHVMGRNQLVLNLAHPKAFAYIKKRLMEILRDHAIDYIKWDMNRDYVSPTGGIRPQALAQINALYRLLKELNSEFPSLEIESCSSGGARVDFGILNHTKRFWTSDCNDALERQSIQQGFSYFFPPEVMGAHIGPEHSHTTGRVHEFAFRAATAMQGHLGIEYNLLKITDEQQRHISQWIRYYKEYRLLMHTGDLFRLPSVDACGQTQWYINKARSNGLVIYSQTATPKRARPNRLRLPELNTHCMYEITTLAHSPVPHQLMKHPPLWWDKTLRVQGSVLMYCGFQLPVLNPESILLLRVDAINS